MIIKEHIRITQNLIKITKEVLHDSELTKKIEEEMRQKTIQDQKDWYDVFTI